MEKTSLQRVPMIFPLLARPRAYLFLMQNGYSTGQTIVVDGGTVLV
jgi:hypothetical protein